MQARVAKGQLTVVEAKGAQNLVDGLTKYVERHKMDEHMKVCGVVRRSGRHVLCPCLGKRVIRSVAGDTSRLEPGPPLAAMAVKLYTKRWRCIGDLLALPGDVPWSCSTMDPTFFVTLEL